MSSSGMDIVVKAIDNASGVLKNIEGAGTSAGKTLSDHWKGVSAAMGGVALGLEKLARTQAPLTEATRNLSASTGISEGKMRDLVRSTSDVSFSLEDTIATMQTGREQGLKSAKDLKKYALSWDQVAKATGGVAPELAATGVALNAIGIEAGQEGKATNAFGFIIRDTSQSIDDFLGFIGKSGSQLRSMGMDVDDTAAIFGALEQGLGLTGRTAKSKFITAVDATNKSLEKMADDLGLTSETARSQFIKANTDSGKSLKQILDTLGLTTQQFEEYRKKVAESGDVVKEQAANNDKSYTWMQKLQQAAKELTYKYGDLIAMFGNLSPALAGVVPVFKGIIGTFKAMPKIIGTLKALPTTLKMVREQGIKNTLEAGKIWPAFQKGWSGFTGMMGKAKSGLGSVGKAGLDMAKNIGGKALEGAKSLIAGIGATSVTTALQVAGVTAAFAALALATYGAIKAYQEWRKALGEGEEALTREEQMYKDIYNQQGKEAVEAEFLKHQASMDAKARMLMAQYILNLEKESPTDLGKKSGRAALPFASGGIVTRPTVALIGEDGPEAVIPLSGGRQGATMTMNHTGTITVRGVNNEGQLQAVIPIVIDRLRREVRGGLG